ncbi:MAG: putative TetR family transcriptional regulator [Ilumatobacteraceae bacterium]|nr:putative TetR family transcriptional regulator [Ilumatobacteraceae bacterium]
MTNAGTATSGTQRLPAAERREQLLQVALEMFAAKGYHDTSMNDVAEAAGVTKPVLYQHFASKKALYNELVDEIGARLERIIFEAAASAEGPRQQVEAGFRAYFGWAVAQGAAFRVLFSDRNRTDRELAQAVVRVESVVADRVATLIDIPGLSDDERHVLAFGVVGIAESTSRHWLELGLGQGTDADAFADRVARLAWSGLRGITP